MAVQTSKNQHIAVIGTRATIASESYNKAIKKLSKDAIVWSQACPLFVPLVEENYHSGPVVQQVIADYLSEIKKTDCDTLILGCTHYPLLKKEIQNYLGQNIQLVDSTQILSKQMAKHFSVSENSQKGKVVESYLTDTSPAFIKIASSILGETLDWKLIDIR